MNNPRCQKGLDHQIVPYFAERLSRLPATFPCAEAKENRLAMRLWQNQDNSFLCSSDAKDERQWRKFALTERRRKARKAPVSAAPRSRHAKLDHAPLFLATAAIEQPSSMPVFDDPSLGLRLMLLWERISWQVLANLRVPQLLDSDPSYIRVEFMDCISWVALPKFHRLAIELRDRNGDWQLTTIAFDVLRPLPVDLWIDQILLAWLPWLSMCSEADAEAGYEWLKANLVHGFQAQAWLKRVQRLLRAHLNVVPALNKVVLAIARHQPQLTVSSQNYSKIWEKQSFWTDLALCHPHLTHFCYMTMQGGIDTTGHDLRVLKSLCHAMGMSNAGWRFLCRHGAPAYRAVFDEYPDDDFTVCASAIYVDWQAKAGLESPLPRRLGAALVRIALDSDDSDGQLVLRVDPRLCRAGSDHWTALESLAERKCFAEDQWIRVLIWLRDNPVQFDRNQWRTGWPAIWRSYERWHLCNSQQSQWKSDIPEFEFEGWTATPLCTAYDLALEGMRMRHCVADYIDDCTEGRYRVFSLRHSNSHQPQATVGLVKSENVWELDQVKGKFNSDPGPELINLATSVLERYKSAQRRRRVTHCYSCKQRLDSQVNRSCNSCGWMDCECGACGCGWRRYG